MPQTVGAFFAIILVMVFAITWSQSKLSSQQKQISAELETMASAIAADVMQTVASKTFDSQIDAGVVTRSSNNHNDLTSSSSFGGAAFSSANDIDDFHNMPTDTVKYTSQNGDLIPFTVDISVSYVDSTGALTSSRSWIKEVEVVIEGPTEGGEKILFSPIVLKRQFSPRWY